MIRPLALALLMVAPVPALADDAAFLEGVFQRCLAAEPLSKETREGYPKQMAIPGASCTNLVLATCQDAGEKAGCLARVTEFVNRRVSDDIQSLEEQGATASKEATRIVRLVDEAKSRCPKELLASEPETCRFLDAADDLARVAELGALTGRRIWQDLAPPVIASDFPIRNMRQCLDVVGIEPREERVVFGQFPSVRADRGCLLMADNLCAFSGIKPVCADQMLVEARRELASFPATATATSAEPEFCDDRDAAASSPASLFLDLLCRRAAARLKDGDL
ncbi:hypothetical protein [uncultured Paracoccus sp.]|uniref:hypothetical protein n=1 Tax=uncultured Paracoccus sp. TaxID=189685 RepID=UPI00260AA7BA|nr:hypothetical protein [uncultured Paracoccus sp.]